MAAPRSARIRFFRRFSLPAGLLAGIAGWTGQLVTTSACLAENTSGTLPDVTGRTQSLIQSGESTTQGLGLVQGPVSWSLEVAVDPAAYKLVPGDQLHLGIWGGAPRAYPLAVTPEGELILPDLGPVPVADLTLRDAESRVTELLRPFYPKGRISLRLISPGRFRVAVTGMVDRPGIYEATRTDRLTAILSLAGGVHAGGSLRNIRLLEAKGGNASSGTIDLVPWLIEGRSASNPTLDPGISIDVPASGPVVSLRGPINGRGGLEMNGFFSARPPERPEEEPVRMVEWKEGDTVGSLLRLAGGISERASGSAILSRAEEAARRLDLRSGADLTTPLRPGDALEIEYSDRWVFVVGAVRSPGRYPYLPGLLASDYINMAGGPTELGRKTWSIEEAGRGHLHADHALSPGLTIRVPERRTYTITTILTPLTSATAFLISVVALSRHY